MKIPEAQMVIRFTKSLDVSNNFNDFFKNTPIEIINDIKGAGIFTFRENEFIIKLHFYSCMALISFFVNDE